MKLRVLERWNFLQLPFPEQGSLDTMNLVNSIQQKLSVTPEEKTELGMITGVICDNCGSPVTNKSKKGEEPKYYCMMCDDFVDTKGEEDKTIWNQEKDVGKEIEFNKAERGIIIGIFNKLEQAAEEAEEKGEEGGATASQAFIWRIFKAAYPSKGTKGENDEDTDEQEKEKDKG